MMFLENPTTNNKYTLPYDWSRVALPSIKRDEITILGSDYVNASFITGYRNPCEFIAYATPFNKTQIDDVWRTAWTYNVGIIVLLNKKSSTFEKYWPEDQPARYQYFVIEKLNLLDLENYILREFRITDARDGRYRTIRHFEIKNWFDSNVDHMSEEQGCSVIDFIQTIQETREKFGIAGFPIILQSENGSSRVGQFTVITNLIDRAKHEGLIDIPETIRLLKGYRAGLIETFEEYKYVYNILMIFIKIYKNSWRSYEINGLENFNLMETNFSSSISSSHSSQSQGKNSGFGNLNLNLNSPVANLIPNPNFLLHKNQNHHLPISHLSPYVNNHSQQNDSLQQIEVDSLLCKSQENNSNDSMYSNGFDLLNTSRNNRNNYPSAY